MRNFVVNPKNAVAFFNKRNFWPNTVSRSAGLVFDSNLVFAPEKEKPNAFFGLTLQNYLSEGRGHYGINLAQTDRQTDRQILHFQR